MLSLIQQMTYGVFLIVPATHQLWTCRVRPLIPSLLKPPLNPGLRIPMLSTAPTKTHFILHTLHTSTSYYSSIITNQCLWIYFSMYFIGLNEVTSTVEFLSHCIFSFKYHYSLNDLPSWSRVFTLVLHVRPNVHNLRACRWRECLSRFLSLSRSLFLTLSLSHSLSRPPSLSHALFHSLTLTLFRAISLTLSLSFAFSYSLSRLSLMLSYLL